MKLPVILGLLCFVISSQSLAEAPLSKAAPALQVVSRSATLTTEAPAAPAGSVNCYELNLEPKRTVCSYQPKAESASSLQSRVLMAIFDGRQPADPNEAYVRVVANGRLEFMSLDTKRIDLIIDYLSQIDVLDTYVERRTVDMNIQIVELIKNSDQNMGYLLSGRYAGSGRALAEGKNPFERIVVESVAGGLVSSTFAIGNLANTLLNVALSNFKSREEISVVSTFPFRVTHGFDLSAIAPITQSIYRPFSIQTITEIAGVKFKGEARLHRDQAGKILLKGFVASVTQANEDDVVNEKGQTLGAKTFQAGPIDLVVEEGCSAVIRVMSQSAKTKKKSRNFFWSSQDLRDESMRDFLFVVQAAGPMNRDPASCAAGSAGSARP